MKELKIGDRVRFIYKDPDRFWSRMYNETGTICNIIDRNPKLYSMKFDKKELSAINFGWWCDYRFEKLNIDQNKVCRNKK